MDSVTASLLDEVVARAESAGRTFRLSDDVFRRHVAMAVQDAPEPEAALRALHVGDLYLACACVHGDATAIAELEREHGSQFPLFIANLRQSDDFVAEAIQRVREKLLVAKNGAYGKLADYRGSGPLGAWLRVVVVRTARDLLRAAEPARKEDSSTPELPSDLDPEVSYLKQRCAAQLAQAFHETLATLNDEERAMLSLTFLDGLSSGAIGKMYGVDGSTMRRRLQALRERIMVRTRELLSDALGANTREVNSLIDFVRSRVDLDLSAILRQR